MKTIIHTPTNGLQNSLDFYAKLNFKTIPSDEMTLVSDGKAVIEINENRFARAGVKLFGASWEETVQKLEALASVIKIDDGYLLGDPSNVWIYLIETDESPDFDLSEISPSVLGNYAGLSLETTAMQNSLEIWQTLGFSKSMGSVEQGWIGLKNEDDLTVSLMKPLSCPHLFFNPSLTYFNGKNNPAVIEKIRELKIPIAEEITHFNKDGLVDNIIIRDPGGYGFFIFSD